MARYVRRSWWQLVAPSLACATVALFVVLAARQWLANRDARVRLDTIIEANEHAQKFVRVQDAAWQRRYDSLRVVARQRDTVLIKRLKVVHDTLALVDTVKVPEAAPFVRSCTALADDCAAFRVSATTALVAADSLHQADTTRIHAMALDRVAASDSIATAIAQRNRRPSWVQALSVSAIVGGITYIVGRLTP